MADTPWVVVGRCPLWIISGLCAATRHVRLTLGSRYSAARCGRDRIMSPGMSVERRIRPMPCSAYRTRQAETMAQAHSTQAAHSHMHDFEGHVGAVEADLEYWRAKRLE